MNKMNREDTKITKKIKKGGFVFVCFSDFVSFVPSW